MNRDQKPSKSPSSQPGSAKPTAGRSDSPQQQGGDHDANRRRDSSGQFAQQSDQLQQPGSSPDRSEEHAQQMRDDDEANRVRKAKK
jgi:hypothetical protein